MKTLIQRIALLAILAVYCPSVFAQTNPLDTASLCYRHVQDFLENKVGCVTTEQLEQYNNCLRIANMNTLPEPAPINRNGNCVVVNDIDVSLYANIAEDINTGQIGGYFFNQVSKIITIYKTINFKFNLDNFHTAFGPGCEIDFDGNGQFVPLTTEMSHTFGDNPTGNEDRDIIIRTQAGAGWFLTKVRITFVKNAQSAYDAPDEIWDIVGNNFVPTMSCGQSLFAAEDLVSVAATGRAFVKYGNTDKKLRKPLIFVEGLDFGDDHLCSTIPTEGVLRNGSFGWDNFMAGKWEQKGPQPIENMPVMYQNFLAEGYDVILLDFTDGAGWIQANGEVLINLIKKINALKEGCDHNIVVGASMGGQIARWALTTMENRKVIHDTGLYCSFDSPQKGANIPLSLQSFIYFTSHFGEKPLESTKKSCAKLNRPAPQQLLKFHFNALFTKFGGAACVRSDYETMMTDLGYPKQCMNIATALGAGNMVNQGYSNVGKILEANITSLGINAFWVMMAATGGVGVSTGSEVISAMKIPSRLTQGGIPLTYHEATLKRLGTNGIVWRVNGSSTLEFLSVVAYSVNLDNWDMAPGCSRNDFIDLEDQLRGVDKRMEVTINKKYFTFMPTVSALDLNTTDLLYDVASNVSKKDELDPALTPFKYVYYEDNSNKAHVEITPELMTWMKDILIKYETYAGRVNPSTSLNKRFNYASETQSHISGTSIIQNGTLVVNGDGNAAYGAIPNANQEIIERWVYGCENSVKIKDGGKFVFGESANRNGIVHVGAGASVVLDGGLLNLNNEKSTLVIEDGGKLILNYGTINLSHPEAKIVIKKGGQLIFSGTFSFTGPGYFDFEKDHVLVLNSPFDLTGIGKTNRFIQLEDNAKLKIANKKIKLRSGAVVYKANTSIQIGQAGRGDFGDNAFTGIGADAVAIDANASNVLLVDHSDFGGLSVGIQAQNLANIVDLNKVTYCNFHTNTTGIKLRDNLSSGMRISYSTFAGDKAIDAAKTNIITARECQMVASAFTFDETGVSIG